MKKKKRVWPFFLALLFLSILLFWFFWRDLEGLTRWVTKKIVPEQSRKPSQETISEEDRKKLEEILKRR